MLKRYAVLTGFSNNSGFQQKSLCDIYDFLKSSSGGAWFDKEILILPEGVDEAMLKFILRRVSKDGTEFLFLYFCGNGNDRLTSDGFSVGGEKIMRIIIEETCKAQITVFDACTALVPVDDDSDYEVNDDCKDDIEAARNDANRDFCRKDTGGKNSVFEKQQIAASRILSDEVFGKMCGSLWLNGCGEDGTPVLGEDGSGVYTASFLEELCSSEKILDFQVADRNARFMCEVSFALFGKRLFPMLKTAFVPSAILLVLANVFKIPFISAFVTPACLSICVMFLALNLKVFSGVGRKADYSYGIYLVHYPLAMCFISLGLFERKTGFAIFAVLGTSFLCAFLLEKLQKSLFEKNTGKLAATGEGGKNE